MQRIHFTYVQMYCDKQVPKAWGHILFLFMGATAGRRRRPKVIPRSRPPVSIVRAKSTASYASFQLKEPRFQRCKHRAPVTNIRVNKGVGVVTVHETYRAGAMPRAILEPGVGRIGAKSHRPADRLAARLRLNARLSCLANSMDL